MRVLVINLPSQNARREDIGRRLSDSGIDFDFFRAYTKDEIPDNLRSYFFDQDGKAYGEFLLPGEIGCYASHLAIMHDVARGTLPSPLMVMEDDAAPTPEAVPVMRRAFEMVASHPEEIEFLNLYQKGPKAVLEKRPLVEGIDIIRNFVPSFCTHCYIITREGSRKFLSFRKERTFPVDADIFFAALQADMKVWETSVAVVCQNHPDLESIIDPTDRRSVLRSPELRLSHRRRLARKKYGVLNDIRYSLSRRMWKLERKVTRIMEAGEQSPAHEMLRQVRNTLFRRYIPLCTHSRDGLDRYRNAGS